MDIYTRCSDIEGAIGKEFYMKKYIKKVKNKIFFIMISEFVYYYYLSINVFLGQIERNNLDKKVSISYYVNVT